MITLLDMIYW